MTVTQLDAVQCVKQAFDEPNNAFRVEADITGSSIELDIGADNDSIQVAPYRSTLTDRSGVTSGTMGTSTVLAAANPNRKYLIIQNLDITYNLFVNFTTAASTTGNSIKLIPSAAFAMESSFITTEAINVCSDGVSIKYAAKEGT
jgi:hypothetical protein